MEEAEGSKIASISCKLVPPPPPYPGDRFPPSGIRRTVPSFRYIYIYILAKSKLKTRRPRGAPVKWRGEEKPPPPLPHSRTLRLLLNKTKGPRIT
jgi:hypothetical protein